MDESDHRRWNWKRTHVVLKITGPAPSVSDSKVAAGTKLPLCRHLSKIPFILHTNEKCIANGPPPSEYPGDTAPHPATAIIISEGTGMTYKRRDFTKWFHRCANAARWPKTLWNMDSRAGGVTEATDGGASETAIQFHSGHESIESISQYIRGSARQAANVTRIRRRVREQESND